MYRNLNASGPAASGSDTTTHHLLPAPTAVTTTQTPPRQFPPGAVGGAAALQNHPHLAGNEACLCSSCHLRDSFFPRSQDGRIFLPHPALTVHSARLSRSTATTTNAPPPSMPATRKRNRIESSSSNSDHKPNEGRRGDRSRTPQLQTDKGEGSSTGAANTGDRRIVTRRSSREAASIEEPQHTSQMSSMRWDKPESRSFSGPSKRTQPSKKYDQKPTRRPDPQPRIMGSDNAGQPSHPLTQPPPSQHSQPLEKSRRTRLELYLDKHGTPHNRLQSRDVSPAMANLEPSRSATPSTATQRQVGAYDYDHRSIHSPRHQGLNMSIPNYPEPPGRIGSSYRHDHYSAGRPESPTDTVNPAQDEPKLIRFSSRSENPQPVTHSMVSMTSGEKSASQQVNSSPTRDPAQPSSSSSSNPLRPQLESSTSVQTQFRFQEPVVPQVHITSPTHPRELSIVQVKWDSERKRRQGYFAQEEGAEKSPFRHYNKANCDFES